MLTACRMLSIAEAHTNNAYGYRAMAIRKKLDSIDCNELETDASVVYLADNLWFSKHLKATDQQ
jgi:hypothetical protein